MVYSQNQILIVKHSTLEAGKEADGSEGTEMNPHFPLNQDKCLDTSHKIKSVI